jgi:hypothetical protein
LLRIVKVSLPIYSNSTASYCPPLIEPAIPTVVLGTAVGPDVVYIPPLLATTTSLVPPEDEATEVQLPVDAFVRVQVTPKFDEVYIPPL